jgi:hypothetical protein
MSSGLVKTLMVMNGTFGRGEIVHVTIDVRPRHRLVRGKVTRRIPTTQKTGFEETRVFRVVGNRVFFLGRARVVCAVLD